MSIVFEPAEVDDAEDLVALRNSVARWLVDRGIDQWLPGEFSRKRIRSWIERGRVHVHRRAGTIVAAVAILDADPGIWRDDRPDAGYIHLLMVDRAHAGSGLGDAALAYAEHQIRDRGGTVARLDAVASNVALQAWYEQRGYRRVSRTAVGDQDLYDAVLFEKPLP